MGTSIKIVCWKGEKISNSDWEKFKDKFFEVYDEVEDQGDCLIAEPVYCSYSRAYLSEQMKDFSEFKDSGVEFHLTYLENDPDESEVL